MGWLSEPDAEHMSREFIFETSVWIDFLRGKSTPEVSLLTGYIENNHPVILIPTILQEVLQGIREDGQYVHVKDLFSYFTMLQLPPGQAATGAAELYRSLRKKGVTIRKSNDCMIAYYAITSAITLVHTDGDFDLISQHTDLKVWTRN
jgi:predicted nucleic acid-binding protein